MARRVRWCLVVALFGVLSLGGGCAGIIYTDPGPNPARLSVPVKAQVSQAGVTEVEDRFGGKSYLNTAPRYNTLEGPFWDVQAFILSPEGGLHQLPPAPGGAILKQPGMGVDGRASFLAPPGRHQLRLVLSGWLLHTWYDDYGFWKVDIPLLTRHVEPQAVLVPGQELTLEDLLKEP